MMVYTGHSLRYIVIALSDLIEYAPISPFFILSLLYPTAATPTLSASVINFEVMWSIQLWRHTTDTGVSSLVPK